jgi:hypothetical protein
MCLAGILFSLSRGGLLALFAATLVCLALKIYIAGRRSLLTAPSAALLTGVVLALAVAYWFGYDRITARTETIWSGQALNESRGPLWMRSLPIVAQFPLFGTGQGTYQYIEPLYRSDGTEAHLYYDHAHNEYLEALVEGGVVRFAITLFALAMLCRFALRALRRYQGSATAGLVWGALFALSAVAIHSFGDFGVHIPAIMILATVIAAQLCARGDTASTSESSADHGQDKGDRAPFRLGGMVPLVALVTLVSMGLMLCLSGWALYVTYQLREAAVTLEKEKDLETLFQQTAYLDEATRLNPDFAHLEMSRARAHSRLYDELVRKGEQFNHLWTVSQFVLDAQAFPGMGSLPILMKMDEFRREKLQEASLILGRHQLQSSVQAYLRARNACPLLEEPHRGLARFAEVLQGGDSREVYLSRAKFLSPGIPLVWFRCGLDEVDESPAQAKASWRHSLELSDKFLPNILAESKLRFSSEEILTQVLPDKPAQIYTAAESLYADEQFEDQRRTYLERALHLLKKAEPLDYENRWTKARVLRGLDKPEEAVATYRSVIALKPSEIVPRLELVYYLIKREQFQEAHKEDMGVLTIQPRHQEATQLLKHINDERARRGLK